MDIEKVAQLARLKLNQEEKETFEAQMSSILNYFEDLQEVDTKGVDPLVSPVDNINIYRKDESNKWDNVEKALENSQKVKGNLFQVPPVV